MIHFTLALIELAGLVVNAMLWAALAPLGIVVALLGGVILIRRNRRR